MKRNPKHNLNFDGRKIYNLNSTRNQPLKTLPITADNTRETKRRTTSTFAPQGLNEQTKKHIPVFSSQQLASDDFNVPYSLDQMRHLKSIESDFLIRSCYDDLNLFVFCRLGFVKRLREAKIKFNLLDETVFLAVYVYDKYFEVEREYRDRIGMMKLSREVFNYPGIVKTGGMLIRISFEPLTQEDG